METNAAADVHHLTLIKLCYAMDRFFGSVDSRWEAGQILTWPRSSMHMNQQPDTRSCGVLMLISIKMNADRFVETMQQMGNMVEERKWLLSEDVMCDFNEARDSVKDMLK
ncbi:uncharacterized protein LOC125496301 [Beta vulgaris subsp. vulgaris]|uniref:uncharacterized protein LOC125496301 n=1 Tax=Beta vulgaris subsp. vulgaris TaxID=3555 RepID=UPI002037254A|nr:uncharacterized protein LOC125496301 [Beta vulgaris subsp. vulgaris]